jgi:glycosyltransferase involved in cell wall biosynthesis
MIEAELAENPIPGLEFVYCDLPSVQWWKRGLGAVHFHYYLWQIQVYFAARQLHEQVGLDIVHHVTYVRYSSPSFLSLLPIPFIWGPVGGGESAPSAFWQDFSLRGRMYERLRNFARFLGEQDVFVRMTARRSYLTYATTEDTAQRLAKIGSKEVQVLSQVGLAANEACRIAQNLCVGRNCTRFISAGRLLHWKGFHLGLRAFAQASLPPDAEYFIVGKGAEAVELRALATNLGIASQVKFLDEMPRTDLLHQMGNCLALVHPSLHESGGFVCLEAMAAGCPVICLDLGGPAVQVTSETGFKVPALTPEQAITEIAHCMARLAREPELRANMGAAGQRHVKEFYSWEAKARLFSQAYQRSVASNL